MLRDSETDILSLWNGRPADEGADIAENLNAEGDVVGFTLEHAAELLESVTATGARGASHCNGLAGYLETSEEHRHKEECLMTLAEEHKAVSLHFIRQADDVIDRGDYLPPSIGESVGRCSSSRQVQRRAAWMATRQPPASVHRCSPGCGRGPRLGNSRAVRRGK